MSNAPIVKIGVEANAGCAPDQVDRHCRMTLADLLAAVQDAIDMFGEEAEVVTDNGQRYGARYGYLVEGSYGMTFGEVDV